MTWRILQALRFLALLPWRCYVTEYYVDGHRKWGEVWAQSWQDAERRAGEGATVLGELSEEIAA